MIKTKIITPEEEFELVQAALKNPREFRLLYDMYYRAIFRFVDAKVQEANATADIVSEVFYKAISKLSTYEYKGYSIKSWLYKIAYNEVMMYFRQTAKVQYVCIDSESVDTLVAESETVELENIDVLKSSLDKLSEDEMTLVEMKYFQKLSHREISEILDITEANAKVKLHRVIKKLRDLIKK